MEIATARLGKVAMYTIQYREKILTGDLEVEFRPRQLPVMFGSKHAAVEAARDLLSSGVVVSGIDGPGGFHMRAQDIMRAETVMRR